MSCFSGKFAEDCFVLNHSDLDFWPSCDEEFRCKDGWGQMGWCGQSKHKLKVNLAQIKIQVLWKPQRKVN